MSFSQFKQLPDVLKKYALTLSEVTMPCFPQVQAPDFLKEDLTFTLENMPYACSEAAICENLLHPILKQAWKSYAAILSIWSQAPLNASKELSGVADYVITKRSPLGVIVFDTPYLAVIEAKRDDFVGGWGQCAVEMLAIQKINGETDLPVYGIVSNGKIWEFGQLQKQNLTLYKQRFDIANLDSLFSALIYLLELCKKNISAPKL
jgi:hypothetical protein